MGGGTQKCVAALCRHPLVFCNSSPETLFVSSEPTLSFESRFASTIFSRDDHLLLKKKDRSLRWSFVSSQQETLLFSRTS